MAQSAVFEIKNRVKRILEESKKLKESMDELSEWDSLNEIIRNISRLNDFVINLVMAIEISAVELKEEIEGLQVKSEDKLEAAAQLLDDLIKAPWYLEAIDKYAFKIIISLAVDYLNRTIGRDWHLDKLVEVVKKGRSFVDVYLKGEPA